MCYSVKSSLRTSGISLIAIIYLISSKIPKFQYLGAILIGWCAMQFAEALIWMTDPRKCTLTNKLLTIILIPIVLVLQPLGATWGSLYLEPWEKNKKFIIWYSIFVIVILLSFRYLTILFIPQFYDYKLCSTITPHGHLDWVTSKRDFSGISYGVIFLNFFWLFLSAYPIFKFWKGERLWPFYLIPLLGIILGWFTDAPESIWCHITSYSSISAIIILFLYKRGIKILD
jgi:hypothetical protein